MVVVRDLMPAHEGSDPSDSLPVVGIFREVLASSSHLPVNHPGREH